MEKVTIDYEIKSNKKPDVLKEYAKRLAEAQKEKETKEEA